MSQRKLKLLRRIAILGPGVIAGLFETLRHHYLDDRLPGAYGNAATFLLVVVTSALVIAQLFRSLDRIEDRLRAEQEHNILLRERDRIAQDLHDSLGQGLFFLDVTLDDASRATGCKMSCPAAAYLKQAKEGVDDLQRSLRQAIYRLRSTQSQEDFLLNVRQYLDQIAEQSGVRIDVKRLEHNCREDCPNLEIGMTRILQEAVFNAVRHGNARRVAVDLRSDDCGDTLVVEDDGQGFDPARVPGEAEGHFGFSMMRWEAERLGGTLTVESAPGRGTTVRFERPREGNDD